MAKKKRASTTKYHAKYVPLLAEMMANTGMLNKDMAAMLGISEALIYNWQNKYPEFKAAIKRGKENPDKEVIAALFKTAIGFWVDETIEDCVPDPNDSELLVVTHVKRMHKYIPPNAGAAIFWAKNRMPEQWKDLKNIHLVDETLSEFTKALEEF